MSTHVKKTSVFIVAVLLTADYFTGRVSAAPQAATVTVPISSLATPNSKDSLQYLYHDKPSQGSVLNEQMNLEQTGKLKELAQEALGFAHVSDEFIRYLETSELPDDKVKAYQQELAVVQGYLDQRRTIDAWNELPKLAQFGRLDAGISGQIATRIQTVSDANQMAASLKRKLLELHSQAETIARNADIDSDLINDKKLNYDRKRQDELGTTDNQNRPNKGNQNQNGLAAGNQNGSTSTNSINNPPEDNSQITNSQITPPGKIGELELTTHYLDELHTQAQINYYQYTALHTPSSSKSEFEDYISTLFRLGRFQNVIIAAGFWCQIFNEGDYPVSMAQQVTQSLQNQSLVANDLDAFQNSIQVGDVKSATESLQEAHRISPFDPGVLAVSREDKRTILAFVRQLSRVQNMIEAADFGDLESNLAKMKETVPDFDSTKAMAIVNQVKLSSRLHLGKARLLTQQNHLNEAIIEFQEAAEAWPNNPDLTKSSDLFFSSQDGKNQAVAQFDHMVAEQNYEAVAANQVVLAPALKDDPSRLEQLKILLEKAGFADATLEKAKAMQSGGNAEGAWETLQLATINLPNDVKLNSLRADLAGQAGDFVSAIDKAQLAESRQEYGYSLTWYAVAQQAYPASQIANAAIDRLSKKIIEKVSLTSRSPQTNSVASPMSTP